MKEFDKWLEGLFKKIPGLPPGLVKVVAHLLPWLNIAIIVLSIPAVLAMIGVGIAGLPAVALGFGYGYGGGFLGALFLVIQLVLFIAASAGLFKRSAKAWHRVYLAVLIGGLSNIIMLSLPGLIIGTGISLYLLFQVKPQFNK